MRGNRPPKFSAGELNVYSAPRDVADVSRALRHTGRRVMLVPTMGALHDGHLALIRAAKRVPGSVVVVSIFINPLQFGADEDLDAYPRTIDDDLALLREQGVEVAFTPTVAAMYPDGERTAVHPGPLGSDLEGAARPTHFAGMLTVVLKLLQIVRPDRVFFGEKDYQQLVLVRQMVAGRHAASAGASAALVAARAVLDAVPSIEVDYLQVRDNGLGPPPTHGPARLLVAARLGTTRLLDNIAIEIGTHADSNGQAPGGNRTCESPWRN